MKNGMTGFDRERAAFAAEYGANDALRAGCWYKDDRCWDKPIRESRSGGTFIRKLLLGK